MIQIESKVQELQPQKDLGNKDDVCHKVGVLFQARDGLAWPVKSLPLLMGGTTSSRQPTSSDVIYPNKEELFHCPGISKTLLAKIPTDMQPLVCGYLKNFRGNSMPR